VNRAPSRARFAAELALAGGLVGYHAIVSGRWSREQRLASNLALAGATIALGRASGLTTRDMGIARADLRHGVVLGASVALPLTTAVAAASTFGPTRRFFGDGRTKGLRRPDVLFEVLVRIPLETAIAEEVVFRGVHLALARRVHPSAAWAAVRTSLAFGLWHVPPTLTGPRHAEGGSDTDFPPTIDASGAVAAAVVSTAVAGGLFAALRYRSGSIAAPAVVHAAVNGTAFVAAYLADQRGG
jgi:membrane protease YdiL (CAAX protease family)